MILVAAATRQDRQRVMRDIVAAAEALGGWLGDATLFSNHAASLRLHLPVEALPALAPAIGAAGATLAPEGQGALAPRGAGDEAVVLVNLTFLHDEPDLRRDVPSVPG